MFAVAEHLKTLISSLPPHPISQNDIKKLVDNALDSSQSGSSTENKKSQWEYLLRNEVLTLTQSEDSLVDDPSSSYFNSICDRLDVILSFSEKDAVDPTFMLSILQDLLETQTISACSHIFSWIEQRADRLTAGMLPGKGKALVLLRTLNDLLSRISKIGDATTLCGRILIFLSAAFPLGERSGVNLRGDYGPQWEPVSFKKEEAAEAMMEVDDSQVAKEENAMAVDADVVPKPEELVEEKKSPTDIEAEKREKFYDAFWSLQTPFSRPPQIGGPGAFEGFKNSVTAVMPVIKEATIKERAMMGSKAVTGSLKRKREVTPVVPDEESNRKYFFSKFLTSPELLELEIADTAFRRQFLFQLLILLSHLLLFTKSEKSKWYTPRNRSLQMDFTLEPDDAKWVQETINKVYDEIKQTAPNGRAFAETVQTIIEREKSWVRWKITMCEPFERLPITPSMETSAKEQLTKLNEPMDEYQHKLGSEPLTEIWAMGYRDLRDLERVPDFGEVKDYAKFVERANAQIRLRRATIERQAKARTAAAASKAPVALEPTAAPVAPIPQRAAPPLASSPPLHPSLPAKPGTQSLALPSQPSPAPTPQQAPAPVVAPAAPAPPVDLAAKDPAILKQEEYKQHQSWLALRLARDEYLHLFGSIGDGDVVALAQEIQKEKDLPARAASEPANAEAVATEETKETDHAEDSQVETAAAKELTNAVEESAEMKAEVNDARMSEPDAVQQDPDANSQDVKMAVAPSETNPDPAEAKMTVDS